MKIEIAKKRLQYANITTFGYSDVGDFTMLTESRDWWQNYYVGDFFHYVGDFKCINLILLNRSPTSQSCYQHISSPTSVITSVGARPDENIPYFKNFLNFSFSMTFNKMVPYLWLIIYEFWRNRPIILKRYRQDISNETHL